ncbi:rhodanese-like domain-containing protein [Thermoproteota archaeon]
MNRKKLIILAIVVICFVSVYFNSSFFNSSSGIEVQEGNKEARQQEIFEMYKIYRERSFPDVMDIEVSEILSGINSEKILFLDIREGKEQEVSMIPGAVTQKDFEKNKSFYKDYTIFAYCTIGDRSGRYALRLQREGFEAYNVIGGILSWVDSGEKVYDQQGETNRVHVYGKKWNLLPDGYEGIW